MAPSINSHTMHETSTTTSEAAEGKLLPNAEAVTTREILISLPALISNGNSKSPSIIKPAPMVNNKTLPLEAYSGRTPEGHRSLSGSLPAGFAVRSVPTRTASPQTSQKATLSKLSRPSSRSQPPAQIQNVTKQPSYEVAFPALANAIMTSDTPSPTPLTCVPNETGFIGKSGHKLADKAEQGGRPHDVERQCSKTHSNRRQLETMQHRPGSSRNASPSISNAYLCTKSPSPTRPLPLVDTLPCDINRTEIVSPTLSISGVSAQQWPVQCQRGQRMLGPNPSLAAEKPSQRGCEVFLRHLPHDCFEAEILAFIANCSATKAPEVAAVDKSVYEVRVMLDYVRQGASRGFAFALMATPDLARRAIAVLDGKCIRPDVAVEVLESVDNCKLFVGSLPKTRTRDEILKEVSRLTDGVVDVTVYPSAVDKTKTRGFAFVQYESHQAASHARTRLQRNNVRLWDAAEAVVDWAEPEKSCADDIMSQVKVLFVRNLMYSTTEETLYRLFCQYGRVEKVKKLKDFAFIHFQDRGDAVRAREALNETLLENALIEVHLAKPPPPPSATGKSHVVLDRLHRYAHHIHDYRRARPTKYDGMLPSTNRVNNFDNTKPVVLKPTNAAFHHNDLGQALPHQNSEAGVRQPFAEVTSVSMAQPQQQLPSTVQLPATNDNTAMMPFIASSHEQWQPYRQNSGVTCDAIENTIATFPHASFLPVPTSTNYFTGNFAQIHNLSLLPPNNSWPIHAVVQPPTQLVVTAGHQFPVVTLSSYAPNNLLPADTSTVAMTSGYKVASHGYPLLPLPARNEQLLTGQEHQQLLAQQYALHLAILTTATASAAAGRIEFNQQQQQYNHYQSLQFNKQFCKNMSVYKSRHGMPNRSNLFRRNAVGQPVMPTRFVGACKQPPVPLHRPTDNSSKLVRDQGFTLSEDNDQSSNTISLLENKLHQLSVESGFDAQPVVQVDKVMFSSDDNGDAAQSATVMYRCEIIFPAPSPPNLPVRHTSNGPALSCEASDESLAGGSDGNSTDKVLHCKPPTLLPSPDEAKVYALKFVISNWQEVVKAKNSLAKKLLDAASSDCRNNPVPSLPAPTT